MLYGFSITLVLPHSSRRGDRFFGEEGTAETRTASPPSSTAAPKPAAQPGVSNKAHAPCQVARLQLGTDGRGQSKEREGGVFLNGGTREKGDGDDGRARHPQPLLPLPYMRLQLGLELATSTPAFTNFTPGFTDTLDYVFIEPGSTVAGQRGQIRAAGMAIGAQRGQAASCDEKEGTFIERPILAVQEAGGNAVAPMPEEQSLRAITPGLPTEVFPSDHVSLIVDLELTV